MNEQSRLITHRNENRSTAILLLHGFSGDAAKTWGDFPKILMAEKSLSDWDVLSLGYSSALAPGLIGWSGTPEVGVLARQLATVVANEDPLPRYKRIALVAHSMGGLVAQRALLDTKGLGGRVDALIMFGTPSSGLESARRFGFWDRQVGDMAAGSEFIRTLRTDWNAAFATRRDFRLLVVAGDRDRFVPPESSLAAFAREDCEVVRGDHLQIVKPKDAAALSVQLLVNSIRGGAPVSGPWSSARMAVERGDFIKAVQQYEPHAAELDQNALVDLALALEKVGRQADALALLTKQAQALDALGTLAGRLKRRWLAYRKQDEGELALRIYGDAYTRAVQEGNFEQAHYQGINVAFMQRVFSRNDVAALTTARDVLLHCARASNDLWRRASEAEALLQLGELDKSLLAYSEALAWKAPPSPWQIQTMYDQARRIAEHAKYDSFIADLDERFRPTA